MNTYFDQFTDGLTSVFDSISNGVKTFYDGRIAVNTAEARLALSESQRNNAEAINDISKGQGAISWNSPQPTTMTDGLNAQNIMVLAGLGLVVFAIARK